MLHTQCCYSGIQLGLAVPHQVQQQWWASRALGCYALPPSGMQDQGSVSASQRPLRPEITSIYAVQIVCEKRSAHKALPNPPVSNKYQAVVQPNRIELSWKAMDDTEVQRSEVHASTHRHPLLPAVLVSDGACRACAQRGFYQFDCASAGGQPTSPPHPQA